LITAAIALSNNPLPLHLFTFNEDDDPSPLSVDRVLLCFGPSPLPRLPRARAGGWTGIPVIMSFLTDVVSAIAHFKSSRAKILPEYSLTFGERLNKLKSSAGEGVARISPVEATTTLFLAESM